MVIMPQLLLLQKTLVNIEGLGRELYPDLNLWNTARPHLEKWMVDRTGIRGLIKGTRENLPYWVDRLPELPTHVIDLLEQIREGRFKFNWNQIELEKLRSEMKESNRRTILAIIGATLLIGFFILTGVHDPSLNTSNTTMLTWLLGALGVVTLYMSFNR